MVLSLKDCFFLSLKKLLPRTQPFDTLIYHYFVFSSVATKVTNCRQSSSVSIWMSKASSISEDNLEQINESASKSSGFKDYSDGSLPEVLQR